ncbi:MAG: phage tail sheath C-terminal domain-containing protein [Gemmatimonadales bacterium]
MAVETLAVRNVRFESEPPFEASAPTRADVACFAGFVARRPGPLPAALQRWLTERGWASGVYRRAAADDLLDVPVPIDTWESFDRLFAWDQRPAAGSAASTTYLGAAVRSFFAEGGRKCYVVRAGNPWQVGTPLAERAPRLAALLPGFPAQLNISVNDRRSWSGIGHLLGLPDVSFLCLPDLPDALGLGAEVIELPAEPAGVGVFEICDAPEPGGFVPAIDYGAPRLDRAGYKSWAKAVELTTDFVRRQAPEVHVIAALPLPDRREPASRNLAAFVASELLGSVTARLPSAFLQLVYPWLITKQSADLPAGIEPPDGALAGVLARVALVRGAYRTAAGEAPVSVTDLAPIVSMEQQAVPDRPGSSSSVFGDRISLFDQGPRGYLLASDVTTSANPAYRPAAVSRLVAVLLKALREYGETLVFEPSGERLWPALRSQLEAMLTGVWAAGGLGGASPAEAFSVRCDASTMTQDDLDAGRLVAQVTFLPAAPIERITVMLALSEAGGTVVSGPDLGTPP